MPPSPRMLCPVKSNPPWSPWSLSSSQLGESASLCLDCPSLPCGLKSLSFSAGVIIGLISSVSYLSGIIALCCLKPSVLKMVVSYSCLLFVLVVSGRRVNIVPVIPCWADPFFYFHTCLSSTSHVLTHFILRAI